MTLSSAIPFAPFTRAAMVELLFESLFGSCIGARIATPRDLQIAALERDLASPRLILVLRQPHMATAQ